MSANRIFAGFLCGLLLMVGLTACGSEKTAEEPQTPGVETEASEPQDTAPSEDYGEEAGGAETESESLSTDENSPAAEKIMVVENGDIVIRFELNDSTAASQLYDMLPMTVEVRNFDTMEKLFHQEGLDLSDAPMSTGELGDLAYYEPTGNVIFYYDYLGPYNGLYALGKAVEGEDQIENLYGTTTLTKE